MRALVYGLAIAGTSTARALARRGFEVIVADDHVDDVKRSLAGTLGVDLLTSVDTATLADDFDLLCPAPGVPETHPVILAAQQAGVPIVSEIELAYRWEQERLGGPRPILAITGTDGKTTTTEMTVAILRAAGLRALPLGNTDTPMVDAIGLDVDDDADLDVLVVECTSFRLAWTESFRPEAAVWLNLAPDHLNWHESLDSYIAAKARIFAAQTPDDVAIGFIDDPVVQARLVRAPGRHLTFGTSGADYRLERRTDDGRTALVLVGPRGDIMDAATMKRSLPHDITNALAASALVLETGLATPAAIAAALATFDAPEHRLEWVGMADEVSWYNDSKATTPHAASVAIGAFESIVLIAGGSRKGVDLSPMGVNADRVRAVVAIGEAAPDIHGVFDGRVDVVDAHSMNEAVQLAASLAAPGDAIVLSPGCASFDWYSGFPARGDHFRSLVLDHLMEAIS